VSPRFVLGSGGFNGGEEESGYNMLELISIEGDVIRVKAQRNEYKVDAGRVDEQEIKEMLTMLKKMNFDSSFQIDLI
jgi:hypothetical protein